MRRNNHAHNLVCTECKHASSETSHGWRLFLLPEDQELLPYCPLCWHREFGSNVPHGTLSESATDSKIEDE